MWNRSPCKEQLSRHRRRTVEKGLQDERHQRREGHPRTPRSPRVRALRRGDHRSLSRLGSFSFFQIPRFNNSPEGIGNYLVGCGSVMNTIFA